MNVLFISLELIDDIKKRGLYTDLLREIRDHGHTLTSISAIEKRNRNKGIPKVLDADGIKYIHALTGNITKNKRFIEKGISMVLAGYQYANAIKKAGNPKYDLVVCATPIITFDKAVRYVRKRDKARTVLLLKDIWPYDLLFDGVLTKTGIKGMIYRYLEMIAERLFEASDVIGCMTPANKRYLEAVYNCGKELGNAIIIPNSIEPTYIHVTEEEKKDIKEKYNIPQDKIICIYGGNLGIAQGPEFIIESIENATKLCPDFFFVICGNGTESAKLQEAFKENERVLIMNALEYEEYNKLVRVSDIGLIYLNWNCRTPNIPSRTLQYMDASLPVICSTDEVTDIGVIAEENGFGKKCNSNDCTQFVNALDSLKSKETREAMGKAGKEYLENNWSAAAVYNLIFSK